MHSKCHVFHLFNASLKFCHILTVPQQYLLALIYTYYSTRPTAGRTLLLQSWTNVSGHTHKLFYFLVYVRVNQMATNVERSKAYYVYFEIFNQVELTRCVWVSLYANEIPFKGVIETLMSRTIYIYIYIV